MTASLEVPELNDIAIEALAAQLFMMEFESDTQPRRWWHQSSSDIQAEYRKKATLQIIHWQRNAITDLPKAEKLYDFDNAPWKRWLFGKD